MKKIAFAILSLIAVVGVSLGASYAKADCCPSGACCKSGQCCRSHRSK